MTFPLVDMDGRTYLDGTAKLLEVLRAIEWWVIVEHISYPLRRPTVTVHGFWTSQRDAELYAQANFAGRFTSVTQVATTEPVERHPA